MTVTPEQIREKMAAFLNLPLSRLEESARLGDLVTDSFILVQMVIELQEDLGVRLVQEDLKSVQTVGDLTRLLHSRIKG